MTGRLIALARLLPVCGLPLAAVPLGAAPPAAASSAAAHSLAPGGRLRVAINLGNGVLAQRDATGALTGVSVRLAEALGQRLGVPVDLIPFDAAGKVFAALDQGAWDLAFLAVEPERAARVDFSPPYAIIDGTYLVRADAYFARAADLDRPSVRIAVAQGAAYDLFLSRALHQATLRRAPTGPAAVRLFIDERLDAVAGVRQFLVDHAHDAPGLRVLDDAFSRIVQAVGIPKGHSEGAAYVAAFVAEMKASGAIRRWLDGSGQAGVAVAP